MLTHTNTHTDIQREASQNFRHQREESHSDFFHLRLKAFIICTIHLAIYLSFISHVLNSIIGSRIILRICTPTTVSRVPCTMTAPNDCYTHLTRQTIV